MACECVVVKLAVYVVHIDGLALKFLELLEKVDPCVEVGSTVVAVYHGDEASVRRGYHVYHLVRFGQFLFQYDHGERRSSGRNISGTLFDCIRGHHTGSGVTLRGTKRYACFQIAGYVQPLDSFRSEQAGIFAGIQYLGENIFQFPAISFGGNQFVKLGHHFSRIVLGGRVDGKHAGCIANAKYLFTRKLPMYVTRKRSQEIYFVDMLFVVQYGLI